MTKTISWLHLTDWHVGQNEQDCRWPNVRAEFERDFVDLTKRSGPIDLVFFSGDLVNSGQRKEFDLLEERLKALWAFFETHGQAPTLIVVPGNHDLARPDINDPTTLALLSWHEKPEIRGAFWNPSSSGLRGTVSGWFKEFSEWQARSQLPMLRASHKGCLVGDALYSYEKEGLKVGILGLNSTFLQFRGGNLQGQLIVSPHQIPAVPASDYAAFLAKHHVRVLMTHQPIGWMSPASKSEFEADISPAGRFDLHLCGHLHTPDPVSISKGGSTARQCYQGASFFGLDHVGEDKRIVRVHGYMAGRWALDGDKLVENVWPRITHKKHDGALGLIGDPASYLNADQSVTRAWNFKADEISQPDNIAGRVSRVHETVSLLSAQTCDISKFPQLKRLVGRQHWEVRNDERLSLQTALEHSSIVFLVAQWGVGKDEFLATCFDLKTARPDSIEDVFVLKCDAFSTALEFEVGFKHQFGVSLQDYLDTSAKLASSCLILDGIQPSLTQGPARQEFQRLCAIICDFAPNSKLLLVGRMPLGQGVPEIFLNALDTLETRSYVAAHLSMQGNSLSAESVERLHFASGGLPLQIDRLLDRLQVASLESVLDEESQMGGSPSAIVDASLTQCIRTLNVKVNDSAFKSGMLLKALSVLPFGETIDGIKHFFHDSPFFATQAQNLLNLALVEAIPIHLATTRISSQLRPQSSPESSPKILRVPKQVRDCVFASLQEDELDVYLQAAAAFIFGKDWRINGKIKLRKIRPEYREYVNSGFGNEFSVIAALLSRANARKDDEGVRRAVKLGLHYCGILKSSDRNRDLRMVAKDLIRLVDGDGFEKELASLHAYCGSACRLIGEYEEAALHLDTSIAESGKSDKNQILGHRLLEYSISLDGAGDKEKARHIIGEAKKMAKAGTMLNSQIEGRVTELNNADNAIEELKKNERNARAKGWLSHANDMALQIAARSTDRRSKLEWVQKVLSSHERGWNEYRAVIRKAQIVSANNDFAQLSISDRSSLAMAYAFCHAQRLEEFDSCHECLWELFEHEHSLPKLYAIFRNSSFIWRLRGDEASELNYYRRLDGLEKNGPSAKVSGFRIEFDYFMKRAKILILRLVGG